MNIINVICLGVRNLETAIWSYRDGLGFQTDEKESNPKVIFFNTCGTKFELYPLALLAQDANKANLPEILLPEQQSVWNGSHDTFLLTKINGGGG
ncbi:MAG: hypothetical protein LBT24_02965 [Tannerella sp.]|jgi:catechol 2,3-dioxygenase-like lactoylglutathione lyase family enzyme|nr:hypothetical protein [Tannerella sp.]